MKRWHVDAEPIRLFVAACPTCVLRIAHTIGDRCWAMRYISRALWMLYYEKKVYVLEWVMLHV